ncbi:cyclic nucleotide-binding domain-containing protein [Tautonia sociabilis]|uniref:Cyclic nucleotide-binding domain-containing protein n=1 Tax=Tautonia sociabilis TaxID=2080755 RepID=A0A432MLW4_9BACT|nr:cyclic nucleotide-binding domain-containing protein [Tautonia sociabilis]RUL88392.1 cyclic nucleotide-binding domain-containing protein [Tautonia sociabilis]
MSSANGNGAPPVSLTIDGRKVSVPAGTTIYDAATRAFVKQAGDRNPIPILCHREHMTPVAVCRVCTVDVSVNGRQEFRLAPACQREVAEGMEVRTHETSDRVRNAVSMLTELLLADYPDPEAARAARLTKQGQSRGEGNDELIELAERLGVENPRFSRSRREKPIDESSMVIAVDHNACILCDRCIRACNDIRNNHVIGRTGKGYKTRIAFDLDDPMGDSSCVACGECMISCPTGALLSKHHVLSRPPAGTVPAEELAAHPLFTGVSKAFLDFNEGAVVRKHFRKGDVICREGDYDATAYYIEDGEVEIFISSPFKHVKNHRGAGSWNPFALVRNSLLAGRGEDRRDEEMDTEFISIDAPVVLRYDKPVATMGPGAIFGEMACMSSYPRSATVVAQTDCTLLEVGRNVLYILQRGKFSKAQLDERYRQNALDNHLRGATVFARMVKNEDEFKKLVEFLRPRVDLVRVNNGEVIFRQGDPADAYYLIRIGFVKVSQERPGGEFVLTYFGPGKSFGEIGLMGHIPEIRDLAPPGIRTATCTALDHVDLVKIKGEDFRLLLEQFPSVQKSFIDYAITILKQNERMLRQVNEDSLGDFLQQGLMNAQSVLVLDLEKCTRCDECTKACADSHGGVTRLIREGLRFDRFLVASSCRSCLDPYCMVGCPVNSIRRRGSLEIIIEDWCIGCGKCAENCPYGNINMHPFPTGQNVFDEELRRKVPVLQQKATTCDLCRELDGQPSCVYACPHDAAHRMKGSDLAREIGIVATPPPVR